MKERKKKPRDPKRWPGLANISQPSLQAQIKCKIITRYLKSQCFITVIFMFQNEANSKKQIPRFSVVIRCCANGQVVPQVASFTWVT